MSREESFVLRSSLLDEVKQSRLKYRIRTPTANVIKQSRKNDPVHFYKTRISIGHLGNTDLDG